MSVFFRKSAIVNVRMILTEEKILSSIYKVKKLINPNAKRQIIKLDEDLYFKDLVESITSYLIDYPDKKNFPAEVYKEAFELIEFATNQFEENERKSSELVIKREENKKMSYLLQEALDTVTNKELGWIDMLSKYEGKFSAELAEALTVIANDSLSTEEDVLSAKNFISAKIKNLSRNLFIEIDLERIQDSSKILSFIGIELADALKAIPTPIDQIVKNSNFEKNAEVINKILNQDRLKIEPKIESNVQDIKEEKEPTKIILNPIQEIEEDKENKEEEIEEKNVQIIEENADKNIDENEVESETLENEALENETDEQGFLNNVIEQIQEGSEENKEENEVKEVDQKTQELENFLKETRVEKKKTFFQKIFDSKIVRAIRYIFGIRIVLDYPALPEEN